MGVGAAAAGIYYVIQKVSGGNGGYPPYGVLYPVTVQTVYRDPSGVEHPLSGMTVFIQSSGVIVGSKATKEDGTCVFGMGAGTYVVYAIRNNPVSATVAVGPPAPVEAFAKLVFT